MRKQTNQILSLEGKTAIFIDWANVYGWTKSLKKEVNPEKLFKYLRSYREIKQICFYFGTDVHPKSKSFLRKAKRVGYRVITKPVKYIQIAEIEGQKVYRRKCDFDMEISIEVHQALNEGFETFIFFTGDGDFEPLYQLLLGHKKKVIVVYASGHIGREILRLEKKIFLFNIKKIIRSNYK